MTESLLRCISQLAVSSVKYTVGLRLTTIFIFVTMIISSSVIIFIDPVLATTSASPLPTTSSIPSAPSTIGQDGREGEFTTQAALGSVSARPTNNIVNTNSFYDIVFVTASSGPIKRIQVTFPAGTTVPTSSSFNEATGIGPGTVSKSGQTLTYTVTTAVNIPAGTKIRLEFSNINNPLNPSANYKVTVTTRNAGNGIIDGPTQSSAYTVKQIGSNVIANNAITSTKPAESFMKRVTLSDDSAGNALGWNPDGATTAFVISEPAVSGIDTAFIIVEALSGVTNLNCDTTSQTGVGNTFTVRCSTAPPNTDELHYVVINLPSHAP